MTPPISWTGAMPKHPLSQTETLYADYFPPSRQPEPLLDDLKRLANKRDVPHQSLLKTFLADRIESELHPVKG